MPPVQKAQARVPVPPLRNQNRPRIGRGDRDVARVRGAQTYKDNVCATCGLRFFDVWQIENMLDRHPHPFQVFLAGTLRMSQEES